MKSIRARIITLLLCCVIISTAIIGAVCIAQTSSILQNSARENTMLLCEKHARELNTTLNNIEISVDTLASYISENLSSSAILHDETHIAYDAFIAKIKEVGKNHALALRGVASVYTVFDPKYGSKGFAYTVR